MLRSGPGLFVKEPAIWVENRRQQTQQGREVRAPLFSIFKPGLLGNTLTTCLMMASAFVIYYANYALFATHLQLDLTLGPALVALPIALANTCFFLSSLFWGWLAERIGVVGLRQTGQRLTSIPIPTLMDGIPDRRRSPRVVRSPCTVIDAQMDRLIARFVLKHAASGPAVRSRLPPAVSLRGPIPRDLAPSS